MNKHVMQDTLWAGTEMSLSMYLQQMEAAEVKLAAGTMPDDDEEVPYMLSVDQGVATVTVRGPLTNRSDPWLRFFGVSSYSDIRKAMVAAAEDPSVKQILLDIDSGGGAVSGVADVVQLISLINDKVKPVTAFTDGTMASAAYWLGSAAGKVYASKVAQVGSIGVISTHMEYSKALKENGVGVTVMRAGKYKALVNSVEPLTEDAKAQLQGMLDSAYKVFVQHVAEARNVSYDEADKRMGQGREFFGEESVSAGLTDGIDTFDGVFSRLQHASIDNRTQVPDNRGQFHLSGATEDKMAGRQALTEQQIAALAEQGGEKPAAAAESAPEQPAPIEEPAAAAADSSKDLTEASGKSQVQISTLTEKLAAADSVVGDLVQIAVKSLNNMQVALGGSALDMSAHAPHAVITEHKRVSAQFMEKFKAGGVAAVDAANAEKGEPAAQDSLTKARLAATRFSFK